MKYKKSVPKDKVDSSLSKIKKKYKKTVLKNKKILDMVVKEYKDSLSDSFIEEFKTQKVKIPKKISKSDDFIDKVSEKIISQQFPKTNIFEVFIVCFGSLYNNILRNE